MHRLHGEPIAVHSARNLLRALPGAVAVVRDERSALAKALSAEGLKIVECHDAEQGMGRTLAAGVKATGEANGWVVALADMPFIQPATIQNVAARLHAGAHIVAPRYRGERGHPVGLARRYREELEALQGDAGARAIVAKEKQVLEFIDVDDAGVTKDIDTPADLPGQ